MKNFIGFLIVVAIFAFFTKPELKDAREVYEGEDSFSRLVREDLFGETGMDESIESFMSSLLSSVSGVEMRMYEKDQILFKEFYLVLSHSSEDTYLKGKFGYGAFTQVLTMDVDMDNFVEIDDLDEFDGSVRLNF